MEKERTDMDLRIEYLGFQLKNPYMLASAPPSAHGEMIKRAFAQGWAGAVIKTLKPDHMEISDVMPRFATLNDRQGNPIGFQNIELVTKRPLKVWVEEIRLIKKEYPDHMLIGSIMAEVKKEDWQDLAREVEAAGVDALELNFSCPHGMPEKGIGAAIGQDPELTREITGWVTEAVKIPVIVKLTPNVTDVGVIGRAAEAGGAHSLAAINTVQCLIGVDLDTWSPLPSIEGQSTYGGYSGLAVKPIGLRVVSQLAQQFDLPISGMGGITQWQHGIEYMLMGATSLQVCTAVMLKGYDIIEELLAGTKQYLASKGINRLGDIVGKAVPRIKAHHELDRTCKKTAVLHKDWCVSCGKCVKVCADAGYSAISVDNKGNVKVDSKKCDGCSLCTHVCKRKAITLQKDIGVMAC